MQVKLNYQTLRFVQLLLAVVVSTIVFFAAYWVINMFYPGHGQLTVAILYIICSGLTIFIVGSGDSSVRQWYETQLSSTRELFATLYDQSPVPYITLSNSGVITICNQSAGKLFKMNIQNLIGKTLESFLTHEDGDKLSVILGTLKAGTQLPQSEVKIITNNNEEIWVHITIFNSVKFDQRLVSLVDINTHKLIDKAKSEFVSLATHQLRTPITAIKWNLDLLSRSTVQQLDEKQADYLNKANRNVLRMTALINDFLSVSKLETGTFATISVPVILDTYLQSVIDEYQQAIEEKALIINTSFSPPSLQINIDENLFHIITSNLLSNAVKYTKENSAISVSYTLMDNYFILTIADSGIGIPEQELDDLFKKFFRASNAQVHRTEGTGLGLYIVKESVEKLGGTITVESVENTGTTFTVTLPINQSTN